MLSSGVGGSRAEHPEPRGCQAPADGGSSERLNGEGTEPNGASTSTKGAFPASFHGPRAPGEPGQHRLCRPAAQGDGGRGRGCRGRSVPPNLLPEGRGSLANSFPTLPRETEQPGGHRPWKMPGRVAEKLPVLHEHQGPGGKSPESRDRLQNHSGGRVESKMLRLTPQSPSRGWV